MRVINVKVHLDHVMDLGTFMEIEVQSEEGDLSEEFLHKQCSALMIDFGIKEDDLISQSYSDLLLRESTFKTL